MYQYDESVEIASIQQFECLLDPIPEPIKFMKGQYDTTIVSYLFQTDDTFNTAASLECRGIVFDKNGKLIGRPLHKFFNYGQVYKTVDQSQVKAIYPKLDGSMIHTVAFDDETFMLKSKKSFSSDVAISATKFLDRPENSKFKAELVKLATQGLTVIMEYTAPDNQIVVKYNDEKLTVLHIRDNLTGEYITDMVVSQGYFEIRKNLVKPLDITVDQAIANLDTMTNEEGYIIQLDNDDMVKIKCPWYLKLHRTVTFIRERDIAEAFLDESLDDVKEALFNINANMDRVLEIEQELSDDILKIVSEVDMLYTDNSQLSRKDYAIKFKEHAYFPLLMQKYVNGEYDVLKWYKLNRLNNYTLRQICQSNNEDDN